MTARKRLPIRWARKLLAKQGGKCAILGCGTVLIIGPRGQHVNWIDEHIISLAIGGTNALKNRCLVCIPHARKKTFHKRGPHTTIDSDIHAINKVRAIRKGKMRVQKREPGEARPKLQWPARKMQSRPFPKRTA